MPAGGLSERGKWNNEADRNPRIVSIESEDALLRLKMNPINDTQAIIVVHGNGGLLRSASHVARFVRDECRLSLPLVYLSNDPVSDTDRVQFLDGGGDAILSGHDQTLLPKILTSIQRRMRLLSESRELLKPFDGFVIDPLKMTMQINEHSIHVPAHEFKIISLLAKAFPGKIAFNQIRDEVYFGTERQNSVQALVLRLRKKIGPFSILGGIKGGYRLSNTEKYVSPSAPKYRGVDESGNRLLALSARDRAILEKAIEGKTASQIADALDIPRNTVLSAAHYMYGGLTRISRDRLIAPKTSGGEWIYKKPPR